MHFKTVLAALRPNDGEMLLDARPRRFTRRLVAGLGAGLVALALLSGGGASQSAPFPPGPTKTASALIQAAAVNLIPCI